MAYKLDIFELLGKIDKPASGDIYTGLSDDERKGFAPLVVARWMSGTSDAYQLMALNTVANPYIFSLGRHPHLFMHLLQASSSKKPKRYGWLGVKSKKKNSSAISVVQDYYGMSLREVKLLNPFPPEAEVLQMAEELGRDKEEITKLKKEYKDA
jgi:hypothetical protein